MKKKIIISLILAMCCIMASIPVSADPVCVTHTDWIDLCQRPSNDIIRTKTHDYGSEGNYCEYEVLYYNTLRYCGLCYEHIYTNLHEHQQSGHKPETCGWTNWNTCTLPY